MKNSMPSSDVKTPCMKPDSIRNAPKYCAVRSVIDSHEATTMMIVVSAVSATSHSEMPSTPTSHAMSKVGDQRTFSTNCIDVTSLRKFATSGMTGRKPATAPARASMRVRPRALSDPARSTSRPAIMGIQMRRLRSGGNGMCSWVLSVQNECKTPRQCLQKRKHRKGFEGFGSLRKSRGAKRRFFEANQQGIGDYPYLKDFAAHQDKKVLIEKRHCQERS